jgi:hypothetical protein
MSTQAALLQEVANYFYFGDEWREFVQNRTLETAKKAQREVYLAGLTVDDDSEFAEPIDDMWQQTFYRLESLKGKTHQ